MACATAFSARWPDGVESEAFTLPAGTPVRVDEVGPVVSVSALDQWRLVAEVPAGWIEFIETAEDAPF